MHIICFDLPPIPPSPIPPPPSSTTLLSHLPVFFVKTHWVMIVGPSTGARVTSWVLHPGRKPIPFPSAITYQ